MFLNPLQSIDMHNTGHALPNKTYLIDYYARTNWQCFTKKIITIIDATVGARSDLELLLGGVCQFVDILLKYILYKKNSIR